MISNEIEFHAPGSLAEALDLLAGDGDDLTVLAGGMSLLPMMNLGIVRPTKVLSLNRVPELTQVTERDGEIVIGAMVRHHRVAGDPLIQRHAPLLAAAARVILSTKALLESNPNPTEDEIRHGIAGNLCRCTGYHFIVKSIQDAAEPLNGHSEG